ncbi:MAG: TIGR03545 family protein [Desulfobacterales bacterium]|nr:TIGR03545 family protein [Desulfobacterales bacterium]
MKKWIRWQGLFVFIGLSLILTIFWLVFVDGIVKRTIESYGTTAVGAKVELTDADLKLFPLGLTLEGIAVTNPDRPMENIVEISRTALLLDPLQLLRRKIIVDEMSLTGIQMNTPRKTSGAVKTPKIKESQRTSKKPSNGFCDSAGLPAFDTFDIQKILSEEKLESLEMIQKLQNELQGENSNWQKRLQELPGKDKFDDYRNRIEKLKSGPGGFGAGFLGSVGNLSSLQKEIQADLDSLENAQKQFDQIKAGFGNQLQQIAAAPLKDVERLKQKYAISPQGLDNLGKLVLGQKLCGGMQKAAEWYERFKFLLERPEPKSEKEKETRPQRGAGTYVRFNEKTPLPDFLIRRARASFVIEAGELSGKIENITPDQDILGRPLTFVFSGEKLKQIQTIKLEGSINRIDPQTPMDRIALQIKEYKVQNASLSQSADLPVMIKEGLADVDFQAKLEGGSLTGNLTAGLKSASLGVAEGAGKGPVFGAIGSSLTQLSGFNVKVDVSGPINDYTVRLSTDLDQALKSAAGRMIQQQAEKFEKELKQGVLAKASGPLDQLKTDQNGFNSIGSQLTDRLKLGSNLLGNVKKPF